MWEVYSLCRGQVRVTGSGEVIGLDHNAVLSVMELYGIKDKKTFETILTCWNLEQKYNKVQE